MEYLLKAIFEWTITAVWSTTVHYMAHLQIYLHQDALLRPCLLSGLILAKQADGWQADYPGVILYHLVVQSASLLGNTWEEHPYAGLKDANMATGILCSFHTSILNVSINWVHQVTSWNWVLWLNKYTAAPIISDYVKGTFCQFPMLLLSLMHKHRPIFSHFIMGLFLHPGEISWIDWEFV